MLATYIWGKSCVVACIKGDPVPVSVPVTVPVTVPGKSSGSSVLFGSYSITVFLI